MPTTLLIETYQIVSGTAPDDPGAVVLSPAYRQLQQAREAFAVMENAVRAGAIVVAAPLWLRLTPGAQGIDITDNPTQASIAADLADKAVQVVVYGRVRHPDTTTSYVRLGTMRARFLASLDP